LSHFATLFGFAVELEPCCVALQFAPRQSTSLRPVVGAF
jgi:hypothetical protein